MLNLYNNLPLIFPQQQPLQPLRTFLNPIQHISSGFHFPLADLLLEFGNSFGELLGIVEVQEALHCGSFCYQTGIVF